MNNTTVIRNADWVVGWDEARGAHAYYRDIDVAFTDTEIVHVGASYDGAADTEIDGRDRLIIPGLVNLHAHPADEALRKGITDETHSPGFHHSSLYEFLGTFRNDAEGGRASVKVAIAELLMSGCTTFTDLSAPYDGWLDIVADSGIRGVIAPGFRSARWYTPDGHSLQYEWNEDAGVKAFDNATKVIERAENHPSGRLSGMVSPAQIDTCTPEILRDSFDYAEQENLPWQIHAAQSVTEFQELQQRHGKTAVQFLDSLGVLGDRSIIGHAIFLDHHPWLHWSSRTDLDTLAEKGVNVAHCPTVFARRGITLRTLGSYIRKGVNVCLGTDTYPHNFLEEMRAAMMYARVIGETVADLDTSDVFNVATIGGARALHRDDIGRLASGCKADLVSIDLKHPSMRPMREPIRSLLYVACERAVRDVYVDGRLVVEDGKVLTIDYEAASEALEEAQKRSLSHTPELDWDGRTAEQLSPMVFPIAGSNYPPNE
ncbi:MAG: amidohydrolase family protein [Rhodospirillales bacterium]|nr:amidohydrolase family protein [Rhodospirillales bacterium]